MELSLLAAVLMTLLVCLQQTLGNPVNVMGYLQRYGYIGESNPNPNMAALTQVNQEAAIKNFQEFAGLPATGKIDDETLKMMALPRCGVKDIQNMGDDVDAKRKKRYALQGSKWRNMKVTYSFQGRKTTDMPTQAVEAEIKRAFDVWASVSGLSFERRPDNTRADIDIVFGEYNHGDGSPFDGPGGTLAHAYFPEFGGDAHFDDSERFTYQTYSGINLFQVAAHEFGHSMGLGHSRDQNALMAAFYRGYQPNFKLNSDDIVGIQRLYGPPVATAPPNPDTTRRPINPDPTPEPTNPPVPTEDPYPTPDVKPQMCEIQGVDAVAQLESNDRTYLFSGNYYWRLNDQGTDTGYPKEISKYWGGIPGNLDAALNLVDGSSTIYFFKDSRYWKFIQGRRENGYPKIIGRDGFYDLPSNIDSAFVWSGNGRIYFTKDNQYYRLSRVTGNNVEDGRVDYGYPRSLSVWQGVPDDVGASFQWKNSRTYFFSRNSASYSRFNDRAFRIDQGYPKSTIRYWLGCQQGSLINTDPSMNDEMKEGGIKIIENEDFPTVPPTTDSSTTRLVSLSTLLGALICVLTL